MALALYRKYRPQKLRDVVGQDHITNVLAKSIKSGDVAHAYLFSGSRGTGKTSVARIIASELDTSANDIYELDAASNRGIDEIKAIRDAVNTLPFDSKYKIYIIDEVHMLTAPAFNALLKTLEEPPEHVIFILATTEEHKLPETIISRCQSFTFKKPSTKEIITVLERIAKNENIDCEKGALSLISFLAEGSFRDAISVFQKVLTVSNKTITEDTVEKVSGAPRSELVLSLVNAVFDDKLDESLNVIKKVEDSGSDIKTFLKMVLRIIRLGLLFAYDNSSRDLIRNEIGEKELDFVSSLSKKKNAHVTINILKSLLFAYNEIDSAYIKTLPIEVALVEVLKK